MDANTFVTGAYTITPNVQPWLNGGFYGWISVSGTWNGQYAERRVLFDDARFPTRDEALQDAAKRGRKLAESGQLGTPSSPVPNAR